MASIPILAKIRRFFGTDPEQGLFCPGDSYGAPYISPVHSGKRALTELGMRYVVTNPTAGTGILRVPNTSFAATIAEWVVFNRAPKGGPNIYLDRYRKLLIGTAPTGTTVMHFATFIDAVSAFPATLANALYYTPVALNSQAGAGSIAVVAGFPASASVMTIPAATQQRRQIDRFCIPTSLGITGDEYVVQFGAQDDTTVQGQTAARATAPARLVTQAEEMCICPGEYGIINSWWLTEATQGQTLEFELSWTEKLPA